MCRALAKVAVSARGVLLLLSQGILKSARTETFSGFWILRFFFLASPFESRGFRVCKFSGKLYQERFSHYSFYFLSDGKEKILVWTQEKSSVFINFLMKHVYKFIAEAHSIVIPSRDETDATALVLSTVP